MKKTFRFCFYNSNYGSLNVSNPKPLLFHDGRKRHLQHWRKSSRTLRITQSNHSKQPFVSSNLPHSSIGIANSFDENGLSTTHSKSVALPYLQKLNSGSSPLPVRTHHLAMTKSQAKFLSSAFKLQQQPFVPSCSSMTFHLHLN